MRAFNSRSLQMMLLAVAMGSSACKKAGTFVHVQIQPAAQGEPAPITDLELQLNLAGKTTSVHLTEPGHAPITFPTDVTLEVKSGSGQLAIVVIGRNAAGAEVDRITSTVQVGSGAIAQAAVQFPGGRPDLQPAEASHEFGAQPQGATVDANVSFVNAGFRPSGTLSAVLGGVGASSWTVTSDGCSGTSLDAGATCAVAVQFRPVTVETLAATLTVSADPGGSAVVALTGSGTANPQSLAVGTSGGGSGGVQCQVGTAPAGTCDPSYPFGTLVTLTASPATGSQFVGWSGANPACAGTGSCTVDMTLPQTVTAGFSLGFCALNVTAAQSFSPATLGCAGAATFANRASLCGAGAHVCNTSEWAQQNSGVAPAHNYWTDDALGFSSGTGTCGPGFVCNTNRCFASLSGDVARNLSCPSGQPMHVCSPTQPDPEGNTCTWTGCGFNSISPNISLGGCSGPNDQFAGALCCSNSLLHQYTVDTTGSDANPGTSAAPFQTITRALGVAVAGDTVYVRTGVYATGESFPLNVPAGVNLLGDEPNRGAAAGAPTTISGTIQLNAGSTLAGFTVTSPQNGVTLNGANAVVRNNTVTANGQWGVVISGSTDHLVALNNVTNNTGLGLFNGAPSTGKIENNSFTGNGFGIEYDAVGSDLGGGASGSVGNNTLSCSRSADFWTNQAGIALQNNRWDHGPPTTSSTTYANTGVDLFTNDIGTVNSARTNASQAASPCACTASGVSSQQLFDGAMVGCVATGTPPALAYGSRASLCPLGTHTCSAAEWNTHRRSIVPTSNYWTSDNPLNYVGGSTNSCSVSAGAGTNSCTGGAMLVCPSSGAFCNVFGCGLDTTAGQFFGGCSVSSGAGSFSFAQGTLCCNP